MTHKKKTRFWMKLGGGIAALVLVFVLGMAFGHFFGAGRAVSATISLEVNPSIEIAINKKEEVLSVTARNEEAKKVIGNMDFTGNSLEVTINALIGSMLRNGYLNESTNSILVSVDDKDPEKGALLQEKLTREIEELLQTETFNGAVLSQTVQSDKTLEDLADTHGITLGKAQLIQDITAANSLYTFEDLVSLSINELNLLANSSHTALEHVNSVGTASDKAFIGEEKALGAALAHAGLTRNDIAHLTIEMDYDHASMVYEIEFDCGDYEYEYEIHATTGEIVKGKKEREDFAKHHHEQSTPNNPGTENNPTSPSGSTGNSGNPSNPTNPAGSSSYIGEAKARAIAFSHAGLTESSVQKFKCTMDYDDGYTFYEIEFDYNGYEYEYEIDAFNGSILKHDREWDD